MLQNSWEMNPSVLEDFNFDGFKKKKKKALREGGGGGIVTFRQNQSRIQFQHFHFNDCKLIPEPGTILKILFKKSKIPDSCQTPQTTVTVPGQDARKPIWSDYCTVGPMGQRLARRELTLKRPQYTATHSAPLQLSSMNTNMDPAEKRNSWGKKGMKTVPRPLLSELPLFFHCHEGRSWTLGPCTERTGTKVLQCCFTWLDWTWEQRLSRWVCTASRFLVVKPRSLPRVWDTSTLSLVHAHVCLSHYL